MEAYKKLPEPKRIRENRVHVSRKTLRRNHGLHWHEFFEIELVNSGRGRHVLNGKESEIGKGSAYLLTPNDFHEIHCEELMDVFNIQFPATMMEEGILWRISNSESAFACTLYEDHYQEMFHLAQALSMGKTTDDSFKRNILDCMLTILIRNGGSRGKKRERALSDHVIDRAELYMNIHFKNNPSLEEVAAYVGLNQSYFIRRFHQDTGQTPMQYMTALKLSYAKTLLESTKLPVTEIAFVCGYGSLANFLKAFKRRYQMTPTQLRQRAGIDFAAEM